MTIRTHKLSREELNKYWCDLTSTHREQSPERLELVCYAGMPDWFNEFIHRYQTRAFRGLLRGQPFESCDVLDVGTGVGRWARWFKAFPDARVTGIDIDPARIQRAAARGDGVRYEVMCADDLGFANASYDVVNSFTVLQHVGDEEKMRALAEIARVLRPGGRLILFENTCDSDDAPHVFPWSRRLWRSSLRASGFLVEREIGDEYIPLLRMAKSALIAANGASARVQIDDLKSGRTSRKSRVMLTALRGAVLASYPVEEVCRLLPSRYARITGFLCRKPA